MLDLLKEIIAPYNLIFILPVILVFVYIILQFIGFHADHSGVINADIGDIGMSADDDMKAETDGSTLNYVLSFLGVGKVPISMILVPLMMAWGIVGCVCNHIIIHSIKPPHWPFMLGSIIIAATVGVVTAKLFAGAISIILPTAERSATSKKELIGKTAKVTSGQVTRGFGRARLRDDYGNNITVYCKIPYGKRAPIKGDEVILLDYDEEDGKFEVEKFDVSKVVGVS